jgi:hypothetical protein
LLLEKGKLLQRLITFYNTSTESCTAKSFIILICNHFRLTADTLKLHSQQQQQKQQPSSTTAAAASTAASATYLCNYLNNLTAWKKLLPLIATTIQAI